MMKKMVSKIAALVLLSFMMIQCGGDDNNTTPVTAEDDFIRAVDMSYVPEAESSGAVYKNNNTAQDPITTLKLAGVNYIRIRLWKNPASGHSTFNEVKAFSQRVHAAGLKVWLTVHYSDTWADPSAQAVPAEWASLGFADLKTAAVNYTGQILTDIKPDLIQIGNETNDGFMYPAGNLTRNEGQYLQLVNAISAKIRQQSPSAKIMLHHAGITGADWFFNKTANVDYDYIGLSYYPIWHGKSISALQTAMTSLGTAHNKKVLVAETAYPFTLQWNDWTNNVVGQNDQIITTYPATPAGQLNFLKAIRKAVEDSGTGIGFAYWGAELTAWKGTEATNGSTWENQALWGFDYNTQPALEAFKKDL
ncbi:MAG: arabinogalactan endo-beta-1,4-galactanase [Bacteroidia bacterium]